MSVGVVIMLAGVAIICIGVAIAIACFGMASALGSVQDAIEDKDAEG